MKIHEQKEFYEKYADALAGIAEANRFEGGREPDPGICWNMLCHNFLVYAGASDSPIVYPGVPEDFDYNAFARDYIRVYPEME